MTDLSGKTVLMTGASGFIGSHLIAELVKRGANVVALVRPGADLWRWRRLGIDVEKHSCDLMDRTKLAELARSIQPHIIFSLGVERGVDDWARALQVNALAPLTLMQSVNHELLERFVTIGTSLEVARAPETTPTTQHGATKASGLQILQSYALAHGIPFSPLRTYYVYGPLQARSKLIPAALRSALGGTPFSLTQPGVAKRYVHVGDVVSGCLTVLNQPAKPMLVQEVVGGDEITNERLVELVGEVTGKPIKVQSGTYPARSWDRPAWPVPSPGAELLQDWSPAWTIQSGLADCLNAMETEHA